MSAASQPSQFSSREALPLLEQLKQASSYSLLRLMAGFVDSMLGWVIVLCGHFPRVSYRHVAG